MDNVLAITYSVSISGTELNTDKKQCITSIDIKETVDGSDVATIVITDPTYTFIEDNIFFEDNPIHIELGWSNSTHRETFDGYISAIDINFGSDGIPVLTVNCMDKTHEMNRERKSTTFSNTTSAEVVKQIVQQYGYTCIVEENYAFAKEETITQSKQTDIEFITSLASQETYPFTARLVGNVFYYVKKGKLQTPVMELVYRNYPHTIISFSPKINKEYRQDKIKAASLDTASKQIEKSETSKDSSTVGTIGRQKNLEYVYDPVNQTFFLHDNQIKDKSLTNTTFRGVRDLNMI